MLQLFFLFTIQLTLLFRFSQLMPHEVGTFYWMDCIKQTISHKHTKEHLRMSLPPYRSSILIRWSPLFRRKVIAVVVASPDANTIPVNILVYEFWCISA